MNKKETLKTLIIILAILAALNKGKEAMHRLDRTPTQEEENAERERFRLERELQRTDEKRKEWKATAVNLVGEIKKKEKENEQLTKALTRAVKMINKDHPGLNFTAEFFLSEPTIWS